MKGYRHFLPHILIMVIVTWIFILGYYEGMVWQCRYFNALWWNEIVSPNLGQPLDLIVGKCLIDFTHFILK